MGFASVMSQVRSRPLFFLGLLGSVLALAAAFVLENWLGLVPCPLCLSQRLLLALYGVICVCAVLHAPGLKGARAYASTAMVVATLGLALAARHVWLQGEWPTVSAEPFEHTFQRSWAQALARLLVGNSECVSISWSFLDLTLPEWSLLAFLALAALPCWHLLAWRRRMPGKG